MMKKILHGLIALGCLLAGICGAEKKAATPKTAPVPQYQPAKQPVVTGEFPVGFIVITFKECDIPGDIGRAIRAVDRVTGTNQEADFGASDKSKGHSPETCLEEYFKIYSNGIAGRKSW